MLVLTSKGLYCPSGNFYIDPSAKVEHAVITHAHSDHARRGSNLYYSSASGESLLRARLGKNISIKAFAFGDQFSIGGVEISFHPAGHILGSSQVRLEYQGEVWVASGDYKRAADPTCEPFEVVTCDVFVTEATFGTPAYRWNNKADLGSEIFTWWNENAAQKQNSVLFAYSLGKAQRVLGLLEPFTEKSVLCHSAATPLTDCYRESGIKLAPTRCLSSVNADEKLLGELFLVPQAFLKSSQAGLLGENFKTAFASGWMAKDSGGFDKGFLLSDHADWNDLVQTVLQTKARKVFVQHRGNGALVRHLKTLGIKAFPDTALIPKNPQQLGFF